MSSRCCTTPARRAYFWATHQGAELDLLMLKHGRRIGVEIKRTDAPRLTPSMRIAMTDLKLERLLVIYPGEKPTPWLPASTSCRRRRGGLRRLTAPEDRRATAIGSPRRLPGRGACDYSAFR